MRVACIYFFQTAPTLKMAEHCLRFSPQIAIREKEAVFVEIGRCQKLYSEKSFAARVQVLLRRLGLQASLAFAEDIPQALVLAKYQIENFDQLPLEALHELADPFHRDAIAHKYVDKMIFSFQDLGIRNLGGFRKIPAHELSSRFGPIGLLCYQRVRGEVTLPWPTWKPEPVIREKLNFPCFEFYGEMEPLLFELKKQLDQIFQRLWSRALKMQKLQVRVFCEVNSQNQQPYHEFVFDFLFSQSSTKGALVILKERLTRYFEKHPLLTPIEALECTVLGTVPGSMSSRSLLDARDDKQEQWQSLVSQLSEIHGEESVFQAQLTEDRRPEKSWKKVSQIQISAKHKVRLEGRIPLRPTYLIRPELIEVNTEFLKIKQNSFRILKWTGSVERISGGWFEKSGDFKNSFDRDYYQAEIEGGIRVSVFKTPQQKYYLHGFYG